MFQYPIIIGFTGSFGSGCTETIKIIKENIKDNCIIFSLSDELRELNKNSEWEEKLKKAPLEERRYIMQSAGNHFRRLKGRNVLSNMVIEKIKKIEKNKLKKLDFILVDSIRNIGEIDDFRDKFTTYIWAIYANQNKRMKRIEKEYYNFKM